MINPTNFVITLLSLLIVALFLDDLSVLAATKPVSFKTEIEEIEDHPYESDNHSDGYEADAENSEIESSNNAEDSEGEIDLANP